MRKEVSRAGGAASSFCCVAGAGREWRLSPAKLPADATAPPVVDDPLPPVGRIEAGRPRSGSDDQEQSINAQLQAADIPCDNRLSGEWSSPRSRTRRASAKKLSFSIGSRRMRDRQDAFRAR